jgi:hypothetical protein
MAGSQMILWPSSPHAQASLLIVKGARKETHQKNCKERHTTSMWIQDLLCVRHGDCIIAISTDWGKPCDCWLWSLRCSVCYCFLLRRAAISPLGARLTLWPGGGEQASRPSLRLPY